MLTSPDGRTLDAVLFDLDGTLLDTAPDLVGALNFLRVEEGLKPAPIADYRRFVSQGALGLIRAGLPAEGPEREAERRQAFLDWYEAHSLDATAPYDGVGTLLGALDEREIPWGIVTNKPTYLTGPILDALGWSDRAGSVVCGDTLSVAKPDPAPVHHACLPLGVEASRCALVGDDPRDLEAAERAGALPVLAAYGYGAEEALAARQTRPVLLDSPSAMHSWLSPSPGAPPNTPRA